MCVKETGRARCLVSRLPLRPTGCGGALNTAEITEYQDRRNAHGTSGYCFLQNKRSTLMKELQPVYQVIKH